MMCAIGPGCVMLPVSDTAEVMLLDLSLNLPQHTRPLGH